MKIRRRLWILVLMMVFFSVIFGDAAGNAVTGIALNVDTIQLKANMSITLTAVVEPADAANRAVSWRSGDSSVAEVDQQGQVTWKGPGTTVIFAIAQDSGKSAACTVICLAPQGEQTIVCPVCGSPAKAGQKYCGICGAGLTGTQGHESEQTFGKELKAGSVITFGRYPQTAEGTDQTPIEWLVLDYDAENNRALLLSRYGLDAKPYNASDAFITWEKCRLRKFLNNDFLDKAFTAQEQEAILITDVDNSKVQGCSEWKTDGGKNTQDKVFLLSCAEAKKYLGVTQEDRENMKSRVEPTAFAAQAGAYSSDSNRTADDTPAGWWWLRSPGTSRKLAAYVLDNGALNDDSVGDTSPCVRPALWISLESDIF